ncbi:hypothetical protein AAUPMB_20387 [Pasteurella multocida subsp. multocida str. Anand1_buffalo]|uniref:hypothetical protein n=1 Tax=Pasteurella multocida TaxID=747 RepID=UPI00027B0E51|nr:hypothetical protein [Pasteurella multocida]EJS85840.1 hypothetical protein AAUPMB_20387 [Pasteurella multocida subsp. multocida str. Anand1_buffalo]APB80202.1 hypothetical protein BMF22_09275 [Pasteurella multocida]EJS83401.1 hypothetical protein KCU_10583 [Pasteurella multocida subsp. multocida str. P52VAC]EPE76135.1 hypothetical protein I010_02860 [Pasteurella multocida 1500C]ERL42261.1 hypothetical protein B654_03581 [Pasteurella multocida subsp. multocida str. PMTB]
MEKELPLLTDSMESIEDIIERFDELYSAGYGSLYNYDDDNMDVDTETPWFEQGVFVDMDRIIAIERGEWDYDFNQ